MALCDLIGRNAASADISTALRGSPELRPGLYATALSMLIAIFVDLHESIVREKNGLLFLHVEKR